MSISTFLRYLALVLPIILSWGIPAFCGEIHKAAANGNLQKVKALLKENPKLVSSKGEFSTGKCGDWTPLHYAAEQGHKDIAKLLLANKADVNAKAEDGRSPLHWAAWNGHKELVELLLAHGVQANARGEDDKTPLHWASKQGHPDIVELLRQHGGHE